MQTQHVSRDDTHDRGTDDAGVGTQPTTAFGADGLFSHPDTDHLDTKPGSPPDEYQRSYTNLFCEPAGSPQDTGETA